MLKIIWAVALLLFFQASALAQSLEVKRYNYAEWTKGRFTEVVTVTGPGKMIFLAGVGAEDEEKPQGNIRHLGNPYLQCKYAYDKMKRHLAKHGATLADVVKQVVYVTDIRYQGDVGKCRREEYGPSRAYSRQHISGYFWTRDSRNAARNRHHRSGAEVSQR